MPIQLENGEMFDEEKLKREIAENRRSYKPPENLKQKIEDSLSNAQRFGADVEKNIFLQEVGSGNPIVKAILQHHSIFAFQNLGMTCKRSIEARNFFLQVLGSIQFSAIIYDIVKEMLKIGEVIMLFEGSWTPPKFLDPNNVVVAVLPSEYGTKEEHVEYNVEEDVRSLVLNTPAGEKNSLLKMLDAYSIRQIELGRRIDLSRSPFVKLIHARRRTSNNPQAIRGVSYFEPVLARLKETEVLKNQIAAGANIDYVHAIKKIRETEKLVFEFSFPQDRNVLEAEFKYLQDVVKYFLIEDVFKPAAMARNLNDNQGLILPELHFADIKLNGNGSFENSVVELKTSLGIDLAIEATEYISQLRTSRR